MTCLCPRPPDVLAFLQAPPITMRYSITHALLFNTLTLALPQNSIFRYLGRVNPSTKELTWPATGIAFNFVGTSATVPITKITGDNAIDIFIDGGAPIVIDNVTGTCIKTPAGLANGHHSVSIRKKSEASFGSIFIGDPTTTGKFLPIAEPKRRMEIIGDSISVGYGEDGTYPCVNIAALEDAPRTYGALTANNISADYSIVAWSGRGIIRNYPTVQVDTSPTAPELWTRYGANDADNSYPFEPKVNIVVINLGTNDFAYLGFNATGQPYNLRAELNATDYTNALVNFSNTVLSKYPRAQLFITSSPLLSDTYPTAEEAQHTKQVNAIEAAVAQIGAKAHFVNFPTQDSTDDGIGCDSHPSIITHEKDAVILTAAIEAVIG